MFESEDMIAALRPVVALFEELGIRYYVGGSVASSWHGALRTTRDVDLIAEISSEHVAPFIEKLAGAYYVSEPAIRDAIGRKSCFNLIHFATSFKVDVFVARGRPFDASSMSRATLEQLDPADSDFIVKIASPEDAIISKLEWYRLGNETSERQWEDVSIVMRLLGEAADLNYLQRAASQLGVEDLLERLRSEHRT